MSAIFRSVWPRGAFAFGMDVPKLRLDYRGLVVLDGANGSGKSSIMNSIVQATFGKNDTTAQADEVSNVVLKDGCSIQVEVEAKGEPWLIDSCRSFKREGSRARETDLFLYNAAGEDKRKENMLLTYAEIRGILGTDFEQFRVTSYLGVQTTSKFIDGTDAERMKVITPFLGLTVWDRAVERIRILKKEAMDKLLSVKGQYEYCVQDHAKCEKEIMPYDLVTRYEGHIEDLKSAIEQTRSEIDRIKASTTSVDNRIRVLESDLLRARTDADKVRAALRDAKTTKDLNLNQVTISEPTLDRTKLRSLAEEKASISSDLASRRAELRVTHTSWTQLKLGRGLTTEIDVLLDEAAALEPKVYESQSMVTSLEAAVARVPKGAMGECPTCFSSVTSEHLDGVRMGLEERLAREKTTLVELRKSLNEAHTKSKALFTAHKTAGLEAVEEAQRTVERDGVKDEQEAREAVIAEQDAMQKQVLDWRKEQTDKIEYTYKTQSIELQATIAKCDEAIESIAAEIASIKQDPTTLENRKKVAALEEEEKAFLVDMESDKAALANNVLLEGQLKTLGEKVESLKAEVAVLETRVDDLEILDVHAGDKGIKRDKLRRSLGFMNDKLAFYMELLGLPIQVWFQDRVLLKKSMKKNPKDLTDEDFKDEFQVMVSDGPKVNVPVGQYSAGERILVLLSLLGTLWETSNRSGQGGTNLLMIDEPFGLLREDNRDRAVRLLEYWGSLDRCVIVSDNTGTCDSIRRVATWKITKTNHVSNIEVIES